MKKVFTLFVVLFAMSIAVKAQTYTVSSGSGSLSDKEMTPLVTHYGCEAIYDILEPNVLYDFVIICDSVGDTTRFGYEDLNYQCSNVEFQQESGESIKFSLRTASSVRIELSNNGICITAPGVTYLSEEEKEFKTVAGSAIQVLDIELGDATDITSCSARVTSVLKNLPAQNYGYALSLEPNIVKVDRLYYTGSFMGRDTLVGYFDGLKPNTKYYYKAVAGGVLPEFFSEEEKSFTTLEAQIDYNFEIWNPLVTYNSVNLRSELFAATETGMPVDPDIKEFGYIYSTDTAFNPAEEGTSIIASLSTDSNSYTVAYDGVISGLKANTEYCYVVYCIDSKDEKHFSDISMFSTSDIDLFAECWQENVSDVSADLFVQVISNDTSVIYPVEKVSFIYSTDRSFDPLTEGVAVEAIKDSVGQYFATATGLTPDTMYFSRVKIELPDTTIISFGSTFETVLKPQITLNDPTNITSGGAMISAEVADFGQYMEYGYGFLYSRTPGIKNSDSYIERYGWNTQDPEKFEASLDTLPPNTTIYYVAFVNTQTGAMFISDEEKSFTTLDLELFYEFEMWDVDSITISSVYLKSQMIGRLMTGAPYPIDVEGFGFVYSPDSIFDPASEGERMLATEVMGAVDLYEAKIYGLKPNTKYTYYA